MSAFMIVCPCCQSVFPLEAALNDLAAREAVAAAFKLTTFGDLLLGYINLFKPPKRVLSMSRATRLLQELLPMIHEANITFAGRIWSAPQSYWKMALGEMIEKRDKLTLPLKSHNYLLTIIKGYSDKAEAQAEAKTEDRKAGRTQSGGSTSSPRTEKQTPAKTRSAMPDSVRAFLPKGNSDAQ